MNKLLLSFLSCLIVLLLGGCMAMQTPDGRVGLGWELGRLADTPEQILGAGAELLPPPFNYLATTLIAGGGVGYLSRRARRIADESFDEGVARGAKGTVSPPPVLPSATPVAPA